MINSEASVRNSIESIQYSAAPLSTCKTVQNRAVFKWGEWTTYILLTFCSLGMILLFANHWISSPEWKRHPIVLAIVTGFILVTIVPVLGRWFLLPLMSRPEPLPAKPGLNVAMVTTFVPGGEPLQMLEATLSAMVACEYPHETWVLDEGDDPDVIQLCEKLGVHHFTRKNSPDHLTQSGSFRAFSKYGNYNAWLHHIGFERYDFITVLDPDHIPERSFLSRTLGYFEHPGIAYVQSAQAYYNQRASLIARGSAEETYGFYSSLQMASYRLGFPIVIGSHNTHRVKALRAIGGFPAHDAEDLMISYLYRSHGWRGVYVPEILARGITPVDWKGYLTQQRRWARSVLDIKLRRFTFFPSAVSLSTKIMGLLHGLTYLHKSLVIFAGLLLLAFMLAQNTLISFSPDASSRTSLALMCGALLAGELYRQRFYLDRKNERGSHWRILLLHYAKWPFFIAALIDVLRDRNVQYTLTVKKKEVTRNRVLLVPNVIVILTLMLSAVLGLSIKPVFNPWIHGIAGLVIMGSCLLIWSESFDSPPPFDPGLLKEPSSN
jgi:cellulose synthase (UDP-forming)